MHVLAGVERRAGHVRVDGREGEIHDGVDVRVSEDVVERGIVDAAEAVDEGCAERPVDVRSTGDPDRRVGAHRLAVRAGDVAASDDGDAKRALRHGAQFLPSRAAPEGA